MSSNENSKFNNFLHGLLPDTNTPIEEVESELISYGYNVDEIIADAESLASELSKSTRLSWVDEGDAKQSDFESLMEKVSSWGSKPAAEIEKAFSKLMANNSLSGSPSKFQAAFRNAKELTTEDKASLLEEIEALGKLKDQDPNNTGRE